MTEFVVTVAFGDVTASTRGVVQVALHVWPGVALHGAGPVASVPLPRCCWQLEAERSVFAGRGSVGLRWDPVRS
jgi:hypothetical protein